MRILAASDVHGNRYAVQLLRKKAVKADVIAIAGDLTVFEEDIEELVKLLSSTGRPLVVVPGNHELSDTFDFLADIYNVLNVNGRVVDINGVFFGGVGGQFGMLTINDTVVSQTVKNISSVDVFLTHIPPYCTKLDFLFGEHVGSKAIREFIERKKPKLVITGHLHENAKVVDKINNTVVVNPGPEGMFLDLE